MRTEGFCDECLVLGGKAILNARFQHQAGSIDADIHHILEGCMD